MTTLDMGKQIEPRTGMSQMPKDFEEETRLSLLDGLPNNGHSQASGFYFPDAFSQFFPKSTL